MMKKALLLAFIASSFSVFAQSEKYIAQDLMDENRYAEAIEYFSKAIKKKANPESLAGLGECYKVLREYPKAERYYKRALAADKRNTAYTFEYGLMLKANAKYQEAIAAFNNYKTLPDADSLAAEIQLEGCEMGAQWLNSSTDGFIMYNVEDVNTRYSDFGMVALNDKDDHYYYSTNRKKRGSFDQLSSEVQKPYFSIIDIELGTDSGEVSVIQAAEIASRYPYHIATPSFSANQDTMFFTRVDIVKKEKENLNYLEVHYATKDSSGWSKPISFPYNVKGYSTAHPSLSASGNELYFISNRPGGQGAYDIYVSKKENGLWGEPMNLGNNINTKLDEFYPVFQNNALYFSSNGLAGIGGLDLFVSEYSRNGLSTPVNMGIPYNSSRDDFAYTLKSQSDDTRGFFSSNRDGGKGSDDIYYIETLTTLPSINVFTIDLNSNGQEVIAYGDELNVLNKEGGSAETINNDYGVYYTLKDGQSYHANISKTGFFKESIPLDFENAKVIDTISILSGNPIQKGIVYAVSVDLKPVEVGKEYKINNIYFDYNKADIRKEAEVELNILVNLLQENATVNVEIGSHCDARGDDSYNRELSVTRAENVKQYLVDKGVNADRLSFQGYGESEIINKCANGIECSEKEHEENRRTVFKVVE
jgi:outer membrane protein OmpA-like peptidoglycan-associated protein